MKSFFQKVRSFVLAHKKTSIAIGLGLIIIVYFVFRTNTGKAQTTYVLGTVQKGTVISAVSGSGQVSATDQIDLKARSSGTITYVGVKPGMFVKKWQTLFSLDARDAQKAVRDAETSLETAQLDLEKFTQAPKSLDVQALEADEQTQEKVKVDAEKSVEKAYSDLLNTSTSPISSIITDNQTPPTITGLYNKNIETTITITTHPENGYFAFSTTPEVIPDNTATYSAVVPQPIGDTGLYIKFSNTDRNQPQWIIYLPNKTVSGYASNLSAYNDALASKDETIKNADLKIAEDKQKIADLYQPDPLDLRAKQLVVQQKEDALVDAKANLSDYYVTAPFDGEIASVVGRVGDTASGTLGTIITKQKIASISLNEVDIAKIKLGQKTTLEFDAIPDLSITGEVAEIDTMGTVSQGVVNYNVKIAFDTDSEKIKPGMSVSASIITDVKQDVLTVPVSAVKTNNSGSYVMQFATPLTLTANANTGVPSSIPPVQIPVETGLSSDTLIEIVSGLKEGDQIITRTITATTKTTATAPSLLGGGGARGGGGRGGFGG